MSSIRVSLVLPNGMKEGGGFLSISLAGRDLTIDVEPKQAEIIRLLNNARKQDEGLAEPARGWRTAKTIISQLEYPVLKETLSRYVSNINRRFEVEARKSALELDGYKLITTRPRTGMRLTWPIELIQPDDGNDDEWSDMR